MSSVVTITAIYSFIGFVLNSTIFYLVISKGREEKAGILQEEMSVKPNPFNPSTSIVYKIPKENMVLLDVFNIKGEKVAELVNKVQAAGLHQVTFQPGQLPVGTYICRLSAGRTKYSKRVLLIR